MSVLAQTAGPKISRRMTSGRVSRQVFVGISALLFAVSAAVTILWCSSMSAMGGMPMPGGWTMSMMWMPGQKWPGAFAGFVAMWLPMMVAMMLPSALPVLWRYREAVACTAVYAREPRFDEARPSFRPTRLNTRPGRLTALFGVGYFLVWTAAGMAAFPLGLALASTAMQQPAAARAVPIATGVVVLIAGCVQFTAWKVRHLACCRAVPANARADAATALRHGLQFGLHCCQCCAGLMAILLVVGVMDLRAMALVAVAITGERLSEDGARGARLIGAAAVAAGLVLIAGAAGLG